MGKLGAMIAYGALELVVRRPATREQRAEWLHRFCVRVVEGMDIRMRVLGTYPETGVLIANHVGYLDIMVFAALHRCVFVSKAEIQTWPVVGWMTKMAGTVFVHRGRGGEAVRAGGDMQAAADAGLPVVFFPEGTTSNGEGLLPFRSGLLAQALEEKQPVTAAYVRYRLAEDNGPGVRVADDVCYWGHASMLKHVFKLVGLRGVEAEVRIADRPIVFISEELEDRKQAAEEARAAVLELSGAVTRA